jgi:hypothetical protein
MARVSGLEKNEAPWHLRWFYRVMRKMFGKANVPDELYARLRKQFSEEQLMQFGAQIAFENYRARWNRIFNVESDNLYALQAGQSHESR